MICGATLLAAVAWMLVSHPARGLVLLAAAALRQAAIPRRCIVAVRASALAVKSHPRSTVGIVAVAGRAERAAGVVDDQEITRRVDVLDVRIVAARALHIAVDQRHGRIDRWNRGRCTRSMRDANCSQVPTGEDEADRMHGARGLVPNTSEPFIAWLIGIVP